MPKWYRHRWRTDIAGNVEIAHHGKKNPKVAWEHSRRGENYTDPLAAEGFDIIHIKFTTIGITGGLIHVVDILGVIATGHIAGKRNISYIVEIKQNELNSWNLKRWTRVLKGGWDIYQVEIVAPRTMETRCWFCHDGEVTGGNEKCIMYAQRQIRRNGRIKVKWRA